jgi:hypothetical protein
MNVKNRLPTPAIFLISLATAALLSVTFYHLAYAAFNPSPSDDDYMTPSGTYPNTNKDGSATSEHIPSDIQNNTASHCLSSSSQSDQQFYIGNNSWLSVSGDPGTQSATVASGGTVALQWNQAVFYCVSPNNQNGSGVSTTSFNAQGVGVSAGSADLQGKVATVSFTPSEWSTGATAFTYTAPTVTSTTTETVTINVNSQSINQFVNNTIGGDFECVGASPTGPYGNNQAGYAVGYWRQSLTDFAGDKYSPATPCGAQGSPLTITITITPPGTTCTVDCGGNGGNPTPEPCPAAPSFDPSSVSVSLPQGTTPASSGSPPAGTGSGSGSYVTYAPGDINVSGNPDTEETRIVDSTSQPAEQPQDSGVTATPIGSLYANPLDLDYTNYYNNYPYDQNTPTIYYTYYYTETDTNYTYNVPIYGTGPCIAHDVNGNCIIAYGPTTTSTTNIVHSEDENTQGTTMPECYYRTFSLQPLPSGSNNGDVVTQYIDQNGAVDNIAENPYGISYKGAVLTQFGESGPTGKYLRNDYKVNSITTSAVVEIFREDSDGSYNRVGVFPTASCSPTASDLLSTYEASGPNQYGPSTWGPNIYPLPVMTCLPSNSRSLIDSGTLDYGDQICVQLKVNDSSGEMDESGTIQGTPSGAASSTPFATTLPATPPANCTMYTAARPYVKVLGGDASAGADSTDPDESFDSPGNIEAFNNTYSGSGTGYAAIATANISGFVSGQALSGTLASADDTTFANASTSGIYGGEFGRGSTPSNSGTYYQDIVNSSADVAPSLSPGAGNFKYNAGGSATISGLTLVQGEHLTIYSTGTITITANINTPSTDDVNSAQELPTLEVVAEGGIDIESNVTSLYGNYIAQGSAINDCSDITGINNIYPDHDNGYDYDGCENQLIVNGSFVGSTIYLHRTYGSIHESFDGESLGSSPLTNAAEVFNYSPVDWMTPTQQTVPTVQAITSLPPIY